MSGLEIDLHLEPAAGDGRLRVSDADPATWHVGPGDTVVIRLRDTDDWDAALPGRWARWLVEQEVRIVLGPGCGRQARALWDAYLMAREEHVRFSLNGLANRTA